MGQVWAGILYKLTKGLLVAIARDGVWTSRMTDQQAAETQLGSKSGVKLAIGWNTSQNIKFGMKLSPMIWGIHVQNLRAQHPMFTKIFTFNSNMFVRGAFTAYRYTSIGDCALLYQTIYNLIKLNVFILSQVTDNTF